MNYLQSFSHLIRPATTLAAGVLAGLVCLVGAAQAIDIASIDNSTGARDKLRVAIRDCGLASANITEVDFKDGYKMGRVTPALARTARFATVLSPAPADLMVGGLDPATKREVNMYRVGGDINAPVKNFSMDTGEVCRFIFAFRIADADGGEARLTEVSKPIRQMGWLPVPGQVKYLYVFSAAPAAQFISMSGEAVPPVGTSQFGASEIAFAAAIPYSRVLEVYSVNSSGALQRIALPR